MASKRKNPEVAQVLSVIRGRDKNKFKYWGVETDSPHESFGDLGLVLAPLMPPSYRPTDLVNKYAGLPHLLLTTHEWGYNVVGNISSWIDLDSENETLRKQSELTLQSEIWFATCLSLQACVLPLPKSASIANYAKCTNDILQSNNKNMQLWLRIPLTETNKDSSQPHSGHTVDSWKIWDEFRVHCGYHSQLSVALEIPKELLSINSIQRWLGEPLKAVILQTNYFQINALGSPSLSTHQKDLVTIFFDHFIKVVISGNCKRDPSTDADMKGSGTQRHPFWLYLDYIGSIYPKRAPALDQEHIDIRTRDSLQLLPRPLTDNLKERHAIDFAKYEQYQRAVSQALMDKVSDDEAATVTTVLVVYGAECEQLVRVSLQAAEASGRKIKVYALEKVLHADVLLHSYVRWEGSGRVSIVSVNNPGKDVGENADILVTDFLGSFGDNERCPERLDVIAQKFLKEDGISIPSSYTSFIQPVTASKIHNEIKSRNDVMPPMETAYFVNFKGVTRLASALPVFEFSHPIPHAGRDYEPCNKLHFQVYTDTGSAVVHGFAGYFVATLYKDVSLSNMSSWLPIFLPLKSPIHVEPGMILELHMWRCDDSSKRRVWYEWCVTSPRMSSMHYSKFRSPMTWYDKDGVDHHEGGDI